MIIAIIRVSIVTKNTQNQAFKQMESTWLNIWLSTESFVALLVACLGSFRVLFATKGHACDALEAAENHQLEAHKDSNEKRHRIVNARFKHFQNSLFETIRTGEVEGTTFSRTGKINNDSGPNLREEISVDEESGGGMIKDCKGSDSLEMANVAVLNSHGLTDRHGKAQRKWC
ncbi:hypothetical protein CC78DRAFT_586939 [Lojkania enalia]|uniref:Uncharacterized protein n=1 Tax=Lojkania enalia TaxID=147567 RepID=A0A9P4MYK9_9PLEO|nr:hypothetical protein CC78DRAFT_586939 [Didymosphaeria enalia]